MKKNDGFTLIELLVVLFIISILSGLILPNLMSARKRARDVQRKQDLQQIKNALRLYYNDNQAYPSGDTFSFGEAWGDYMKEVPQDPLGDDSPYGYCLSSDEESFILWASLENASDFDIGESQSRCPSTLCDVVDSYTCSKNCYHVCTN